MLTKKIEKCPNRVILLNLKFKFSSRKLPDFPGIFLDHNVLRIFLKLRKISHFLRKFHEFEGIFLMQIVFPIFLNQSSFEHQEKFPGKTISVSKFHIILHGAAPILTVEVLLFWNMLRLLTFGNSESWERTNLCNPKQSRSH
jgi:hypothetical protein